MSADGSETGLEGLTLFKFKQLDMEIFRIVYRSAHLRDLITFFPGNLSSLNLILTYKVVYIIFFPFVAQIS